MTGGVEAMVWDDSGGGRGLMMMIGSLCHCIVDLCILRERHGLQNCSQVLLLLRTCGSVRGEAALHGCGTSLVCLFYAIATVFELYHGSDMR